MMSKLLDHIVRACDELKLQVDIGLLVDLADGHRIGSIVRIRDIGAKNGLLVVPDYSEVMSHLDEISQLGYGFSVLDEPSEEELYDLDLYMEMFRDWEWSGAEMHRPSWLRKG